MFQVFSVARASRRHVRDEPRAPRRREPRRALLLLLLIIIIIMIIIIIIITCRWRRVRCREGERLAEVPLLVPPAGGYQEHLAHRQQALERRGRGRRAAGVGTLRGVGREEPPAPLPQDLRLPAAPGRGLAAEPRARARPAEGQTAAALGRRPARLARLEAGAGPPQLVVT